MQTTDPRHPPWYPYEKLELLTELIKAANVPPDELLPIVRLISNISWQDVALPRGRTLRQAQAIYQDMMMSTAPVGLPRSSSLRETPQTSDLRRAYNFQGQSSAPSTGGRYQDIQPKPAGLTGLLNPPSPDEPLRKKRGRPPKAETEMRRQDALARGETYPPPKRRSIAAGPSSLAPNPPVARPSLVATQAAQAVMAVTPEPAPASKEPSVSSSGKRKRGRPARIDTEARPLDDEPSSTSGHAAERSPSRPYPDILSRDPQAAPSSFRAPHRGD